MKPKLLFLATEDWFVRSHFSPMVARAATDGYDVVVAARAGPARFDLEALGARVIDLPHARGRNGVIDIACALGDVRRVFATERPALIHAIALKPIVLTMLAIGAAPGAELICAVTGRGHLATSQNPITAIVRTSLRAMIAKRVRSGRALALVENQDDRAWLERGKPFPADRIATLPGAGVDLNRFMAAPEPGGPIRIGVAARLVRSKGVDVAVAAFVAMRATQNFDVELHIAGERDIDNPSAYSSADLDAWRATPGVCLRGFVEDMPTFWREMHIACLPSRGGEGLPRALIEASAIGRPVVTTDVPGCREFVKDGETGLVVVPDAICDLTAALSRLVKDPPLRRLMGAQAHRRVEAAYTTAHVADAVSLMWSRALSSAGRSERQN